MQNEALVRAVDVCIQKMQGGEKIEQALELYPQWSVDLTPPLEAAQVLRVYSDSLAAIAGTSSQYREQFFVSAQQLNQKSNQNVSLRTWAFRLVVIFCLSVAAMWILATVSNALPGSLFYPLKSMYWQARLAVTTSPLNRLVAERNYDQQRLDEITTLFKLGQPAKVEFAGLLEQNQPDNWLVGGIPVVVPPQTQVIGEIQNQTWVQIQGELGKDGTIVADLIRPREYAFDGTLQEVAPDELRVSNIPVRLSSDTLVHGSPMAGSQVKVITIRLADDSLVARLVDATEPTP